MEEMDVSSIRRNKILALAADPASIEQCKNAINEYGAITLPVVGKLADGSRVVLSGECEFTALKEAGAQKIMAATADILEDDAGGAKLSLLLSSLRKGPGALCEGMLLRAALEGGANRAELGQMLGRSASWLSNRLALATRLDCGVREMLTHNLLDARSAEEIARLPDEAQFGFAQKAVRDGLPKSAIEALVSCYNSDGCPGEVREQILRDPRGALARTADGRRSVEYTASMPEADSGPGHSPEGIAACLTELKKPLAWIGRALYNSSPADASPHRRALIALEEDVAALLKILHGLIYPGKKEVGSIA
jgi:ParB family chromosome partitioning protein